MLKTIAPPLLCLLMGFAMQRGSTCCLAATFEMVHARRSDRLISIAEAALWVVAIAGLAEASGLVIGWPASAEVGGAAIVGGVLLGIGAFLNRACVIGTVARIGAGEWAYLWTPVGFFAACFAAAQLAILPPASLRPMVSEPLPIAVAIIAATIAVALIVWRLRSHSGALAKPRPPHTWEPQTATTVIGIAFAALLIVAGEWTYTDVLQAAASGTDMRLVERGLWCLCLLAGTIIGGASAGLLKSAWPSLRAQIECFAGGVLIGFGSLLVPGGNDSLVLLGVPMLSTSAWAATATMFVTMIVVLTIYLRRAGVPA